MEGSGMTWSTASEKRETYLMVFDLTLSTKDENLPEKCIYKSESSMLIIFIFLFATYCNMLIYFSFPCRGSAWLSSKERSTNSVINDKHLAKKTKMKKGGKLTFFCFIIRNINIPCKFKFHLKFKRFKI